MKAKPRGVAMIININKTLGIQERAGSEVDEELMKKLFQQLGFLVIQHNNLSAKVCLSIIIHYHQKPMWLSSRVPHQELEFQSWPYPVI